MAKIGFVGFGEVNTPVGVIIERCGIAAQELEKEGLELVKVFPVADDYEEVQVNDAIAKLQESGLIRDAFTVADRSVKLSMERRRQEGIPEDLEFIFRFGPAEMELENSCTRQPRSLSYDQIGSILRSGAEFQLHLRNNMYYILDPVRFENGTEADFWRLMNEKCPNAVPKRYRT